jgi:hypothetical protein
MTEKMHENCPDCFVVRNQSFPCGKHIGDTLNQGNPYHPNQRLEAARREIAENEEISAYRTLPKPLWLCRKCKKDLKGFYAYIKHIDKCGINFAISKR